jgi:hypothetical protein
MSVNLRWTHRVSAELGRRETLWPILFGMGQRWHPQTERCIGAGPFVDLLVARGR